MMKQERSLVAGYQHKFYKAISLLLRYKNFKKQERRKT